MRSSKSRSRSKSNRQRSLGNIVNRVFDSSGPEGKVRGTPQQIIDKYLMLARDAQLSNDRVAEQNFLQHAEHYTRMLGEAQRELNREQELRQSQAGEGGHHGGHGYTGNHGQQNGNHGQQNGDRSHHRPRHEDRAERDAGEQRSGIAGRDEERDEGPGLVETPEARMEQRGSAVMMPAMPDPDAPGAAPAHTPDAPAEVPAAEGATEGAAKPRKPRGPRKPREKRDAAGSSDSPADAAE